MTSQLAPNTSQAEYLKAKEELGALEATYKEVAADKVALQG
jgi:hypothetical protein